MAAIGSLETFAMERLSLSATQEHLGGKTASFNTTNPHSEPPLSQFNFVALTHLLIQEGSQNEAQWKWPLLIFTYFFVTLHPTFITRRGRVLHDEGLMIYFLSWKVEIVRKAPENCAEPRWISARR